MSDIETFIFRSTFVGDGPDLIRSISTENLMKIFTQDIAALFLFYDSKNEDQIHQQALDFLKDAFEPISGKLLVITADSHNSIST